MYEKVTELFKVFEKEGRIVTRNSKDILEEIMMWRDSEEIICLFENQKVVELFLSYLLNDDSSDKESRNIIDLFTLEPTIIKKLGSWGLAHQVVPIISALKNPAHRLEILSNPFAVYNLAQHGKSGAIIDIIKNLGEAYQFSLFSKNDVLESIFCLFGGSEAVIDIVSKFEKKTHIDSLLQIDTPARVRIASGLIRHINSDKNSELGKMFDLDGQIEILKIKGVAKNLCSTPNIILGILNETDNSAVKVRVLSEDSVVSNLCHKEASDDVFSIIDKLSQKEKLAVLTSEAEYDYKCSMHYGPATELALSNPDGFLTLLNSIQSSNDKASILLCEETIVYCAYRCKPDILADIIGSIRSSKDKSELLFRIAKRNSVSPEQANQLRNIINDIENFDNYKEMLRLILESIKEYWDNRSKSK